MTNFGMVLEVQEKRVSRGSATPPSQVVGSIAKIFWAPNLHWKTYVEMVWPRV